MEDAITMSADAVSSERQCASCFWLGRFPLDALPLCDDAPPLCCGSGAQGRLNQLDFERGRRSGVHVHGNGDPPTVDHPIVNDALFRARCFRNSRQYAVCFGRVCARGEGGEQLCLVRRAGGR